MKKKIMSVVQGREDPTSLHPGDAFFIFNGFKSIDTQLTGHFSDDSGERPKSMIKNKRTITLSYAESCLLDRRSGGHGPVCQNEHLLVISKAPLEIPSHMPRVSRGHYQGSNLGDNIGYVTYQPWNASWQLQFGEKKALYGKHRTDVGGETVGLKTEDGDDKASCKRSDNDMLPVCYHAMPKELYDTLTSEYPLIASIDLTPGEGVNALVHVRKRLPYLGVCFTSSHVEFLQKRIENLVYRGMRDEEDADLYEPALANLLHCKKKTQKKDKPEDKKGSKKEDKKNDEEPDKIKKPKKEKDEKEDDTGKGSKRKNVGEPATAPKKSKTELLAMLGKLKAGATADGEAPTLDSDEQSDEEED